MGTHNDLIAEYDELSTAEDRLEWLVARTPLLAPLGDDELDDRLLVPECISRLWFLPTAENGRCHFRTRSDSAVVHSVAAFIGDLYSNRSAEDILNDGVAPLRGLKLEQLLSFNRRRTVERLWTMIHDFAAAQR